MKWNKILSYIGYFMKWLNLLIILFISITMAYSTYLISNSSGSREFLEQIPTLPMKPNLTVIISIITYIVLLIIMQLKEKQERNISLYRKATEDEESPWKKRTLK